MILTLIKLMSLAGQTLVFTRSKACVCPVKRECLAGTSEMYTAFLHTKGASLMTTHPSFQFLMPFTGAHQRFTLTSAFPFFTGFQPSVPPSTSSML